MAMFGFVSLLALLVFFTLGVLNVLMLGGEEFSPLSIQWWIPCIIVLLFLWYKLWESSPIQVVVN